MNKFFVSLILFALIWLQLPAAGSEPTDSIISKRSFVTHIRMDDGVLLNTTVYLPKKKGKCPAVLVRTPYNKNMEQWMGKAFGLYNVAVVLQDVRGKYQSEGEYYPFVNERKDGLKTLQWIREQSWSNGIIGGWGASYVGYTQWCISDSLDFLVPLLTGANLYDFVYPDQIFSLQSAFVWGFQNASPDQNSIPREKINAGLHILPLSAADDSTVKEIPFLTDWLSHENEDHYWKAMNCRGITKAPVLCIAGWYDIFLKSQLSDFQALNENGNPSNRMIIGPWCHGSQGYANDYGGIKKTGSPRKIFSYTVKILKGKDGKFTSPLKDVKYNLFIMERNEYVGSDVWPPRETKVVPYFLGPAGTLNPVITIKEGKLTYTYDPADPYPSHGGTALGDSVGPAKQNNNLERTDQLVFETEEMQKPLILLGPVSATLWLTTDVPCTDIIFCLQDVFPDGKIINIQEGGSKVYSEGDVPQQKNISLWATGYQLNPGHRLKVVITSSWFPRYNRNLNTCESLIDARNMQKANQTIHFGSNHPSSINLPLFEFLNQQP